MTQELTVRAALPRPAAGARYLTAGAVLCAAEALGGKARIAWPNHVLLDGAPVCDVTVRAAGEGAERGLVFAFSLTDAPDDPALETRLRAGLGRLMEGCPDDREAVLQRYCDRCDTLMKFVDVTYRGMPVYGFAFAVDKHGGLMVMTQVSRTVVTVYTGEASIVREEDDTVS